MFESEIKKVKDDILEQIKLMDEEDLKKVLEFLSDLANQKEHDRG